MLQSIRFTKAAGNAAVAVRYRNALGQFWNFSTLAAVNAESADTRYFLAEKADSDAAESLYVADVPTPEGVWLAEAFRTDTGEYLGECTTALDATISSRSTFAGGAVASVTAGVTLAANQDVRNLTGSITDKTGYSLTTAPPTAADNATAVWEATARTLTAGGITVGDIEASTVLAKETTVASRLAAADYTAPPSASSIATAIWGATDRTLTGFGSLVSDIATAVWGAAARTLTAFGFTVPATVADKSGYSLISEYDAAKTAASQASSNLMAADVSEILTAQDALASGISMVLAGVGTILDIEQGKWEIVNNQMIFYARDGDEIMRFNLQDKAGQPNETEIYKRVPV